MEKLEGENLFMNTPRIQDGNAVATEEVRPNIEALTAKRDQYAREALAEVQKKLGAQFVPANLGQITAEVSLLLARKHNINLDLLLSGAVHSDAFEDKRALDAITEFMSTYPEDYLDNLVKSSF
jgi:hypothetical protein